MAEPSADELAALKFQRTFRAKYGRHAPPDWTSLAFSYEIPDEIMEIQRERSGWAREKVREEEEARHCETVRSLGQSLQDVESIPVAVLAHCLAGHAAAGRHGPHGSAADAAASDSLSTSAGLRTSASIAGAA